MLRLASIFRRTDLVIAGGKKAKKSKPKSKTSDPEHIAVTASTKSSAVAIADGNGVHAEVFVKGTTGAGQSTPSDTTQIVVTTGGDTQTKSVLCLFCREEIE